MSDRDDLIRHIIDLAVVRGKVTLASGREADYYIDLRRVSLDGVAAPVVGRVMRELVSDWDFDAAGGLIHRQPVLMSHLPTVGSAFSLGDQLV